MSHTATFPAQDVARANTLIDACERDLVRRLSQGEARDLLMDNTPWDSGYVFGIASSLERPYAGEAPEFTKDNPNCHAQCAAEWDATRERRPFEIVPRGFEPLAPRPNGAVPGSAWDRW